MWRLSTFRQLRSRHVQQTHDYVALTLGLVTKQEQKGVLWGPWRPSEFKLLERVASCGKIGAAIPSFKFIVPLSLNSNTVPEP